MFTRFRRRAAHTPATTMAAPEEAPKVADADVPARAQRLREAIQQADIPVGQEDAEPSWFANLRSGRLVTLGPQEERELRTYLYGSKPSAALTDEACSIQCGRIASFGVLLEMEREGITLVCPPRQELIKMPAPELREFLTSFVTRASVPA